MIRVGDLLANNIYLKDDPGLELYNKAVNRPNYRDIIKDPDEQISETDRKVAYFIRYLISGLSEAAFLTASYFKVAPMTGKGYWTAVKIGLIAGSIFGLSYTIHTITFLKDRADLFACYKGNHKVIESVKEIVRDIIFFPLFSIVVTSYFPKFGYLDGFLEALRISGYISSTCKRGLIFLFQRNVHTPQ